MEETPQNRARRKFTGGALDQIAHILGAISASTLVVGLVGPFIAASTGGSKISPDALAGVAALALVMALGGAGGAIFIKGLARRLDDDGRAWGGTPAPRQRRGE